MPLIKQSQEKYAAEATASQGLKMSYVELGLWLKQTLGQEFGVAEMEEDTPFSAYGVDSLNALEVRQKLADLLQVWDQGPARALDAVPLRQSPFVRQSAQSGSTAAQQ